MKISNRFTMAVHIIAMTEILKDSKDYICTSEVLAKSVNTNPVVIRRIISKLKSAGILAVRSGVGGTYLIQDINHLNLLDVYNAVEVVEENQLFNCHTDENCECSIGANIHIILKEILTNTQITMENMLKAIDMAQIVNSIKANLTCKQ